MLRPGPAPRAASSSSRGGAAAAATPAAAGAVRAVPPSVGALPRAAPQRQWQREARTQLRGASGPLLRVVPRAAKGDEEDAYEAAKAPAGPEQASQPGSSNRHGQVRTLTVGRDRRTRSWASRATDIGVPLRAGPTRAADARRARRAARTTHTARERFAPACCYSCSDCFAAVRLSCVVCTSVH